MLVFEPGGGGFREHRGAGMRGGSFAFGVPMLWAAGCLAVPAMGVARSAAVYAITAHACLFPRHNLQDTYFVVLHFHDAIRQAVELVAVLGLFACWYHFFPKVTGYSYSERLGRIHFWLSIAGIGALYLMEIIFTVQQC